MEEKRPIGDVQDLDPRQVRYGAEDALEVLGVARQHRDVADLVVALDANEVDRIQQTARVGDRGRERREGTRVVLEPYAKGGAERRRGMLDRNRRSHARSMAAATAWHLRDSSDPTAGFPRRSRISRAPHCAAASTALGAPSSAMPNRVHGALPMRASASWSTFS